MNEPPAGRDYLDESFVKNAAIVLTGSLMVATSIRCASLIPVYVERCRNCRLLAVISAEYEWMKLFPRLQLSELPNDGHRLVCSGRSGFQHPTERMQRPLLYIRRTQHEVVLILRHRPSECSFQNTDLSGLKSDGCDLSKRIEWRQTHRYGSIRATGISLEPGRCQLRGTRINMDTVVATLEAQGLIIG